jgi:hypothetical protein
VVTRAGTPFTPRRSSGSPDQAGHRALRASEGPRQPPCAVRRAPLPKAAGGATNPATDPRSGQRRHGPGVERPPPSPFERQPDPRATTAATSDHARRASPWCRCRSPCAVRRCRRQPEARRTRPPTPARGSGATAPVWSDRRRRPFERQPGPPSGHRRHERPRPSSVALVPLSFAVRRAPLPKAAGGATNPATDPRSGQRRHGPGVERPPPSAVRAAARSPSDHRRHERPRPSSVALVPLSFAVRRAPLPKAAEGATNPATDSRSGQRRHGPRCGATTAVAVRAAARSPSDHRRHERPRPSSVALVPLSFAVRRAPLPKAAGGATNPATDSRSGQRRHGPRCGATTAVAVRAAARSPSDHRRHERPRPSSVALVPLSFAVRHAPCAAAEGSRRRDEPGHRPPLGAAAPRPRCGATAAVAVRAAARSPSDHRRHERPRPSSVALRPLPLTGSRRRRTPETPPRDPPAPPPRRRPAGRCASACGTRSDPRSRGAPPSGPGRRAGR